MEEKWIKVYEIDNYQPNTSVWLEEILKKDNIPYKTEIEEYWEGIRIPKYMQRLKIFIPKEYENNVKKYIEECENPNSLDIQNIEELKDVNDDENDKEIKKYNNIRKSFFRFYIYFMAIVMILVIIAAILR